MLTERQRAWISAVILAVVMGGLIAAVMLSPLREVLTSPERLRDVVRSFGWLGPLAVIGLHILQVVVAPIPGQGIDLANGYLFGWWLGAALSFIGLGLGTALAIGLARRFGRPLVEVLITPTGYQKIKPYMHQRSQWIFFILFLLPGTPDDFLCFAIGLTAIPVGRAIAIALFGRAPGMLTAVLFGATGQGLGVLEFTILAIAVSLVLGWIIWKTPLGRIIRARQPPA